MRRDANEVARRTFLKGVAAGVVGVGLGSAFSRPVRADEPAGTEEAAKTLPTRVFGRTGRAVTVIGFGAGGLKADNARLLPAAVERGINFIDTSWRYTGGQSETQIGAFLASYPDRERLFVNTKASGFRPPQGTAKEVYAAFREEVLASLERLQTDYVDGLMWPHGATSPEQIRNPAMQEAMQKLREEGLVRFFGMSSHSNYRATCLAAIEDGFYDHLLTVINVCTQNKVDPDAEEVGAEEELPPEPKPEKEGEAKPGDAKEGERKEGEGKEGGDAYERPPRRRPGRPIEDTRAVLDAARKKNVGIMAMKVAKSGFLRPDADALLAAALGERADLSRHQRLYTYGMQQEGVHTVVIGMHAVSHVREALAIA